MDYYTNEASLKATYGEKEASGLMQQLPGLESNVRLEKAAAQAYAEINDFLATAGYAVPLDFSPFGVEVEDPDVFVILHPAIQGISDCFTAYHLASTGDLAKKKYEQCRKEGLAYLELIRSGTIRLSLDTGEPAGIGGFAVVARPSVFNKHLKRVEDIFGNTVESPD